MPKVAILDDSALMRRIIRKYLEDGGFEVEEWTNLSAFEIVEKTGSSKPDLVLSDYQMPGVNGVTVAKMVMKADPKIPVMILTAIRDPEVNAILGKFNVKRILPKPLSAEELIQAIREALA